MSELVRPNIVATAGYIPGEQPTDTRTIKLNTNENPYPPSPKVMEAIRAVTPEQLRRYPNPNARPFREAAAKVHGVPPDWIMTFNGGDELLAVAIRATAGNDRSVAFLEPSYSLYPVLSDVQGAKKIILPYEYDAGRKQEAGNTNQEESAPRWSLPQGIERVEASILLIVNPNAPTGHLNSLADLERIASMFAGLVLIDEAYIDFATESALGLVRKYSNILLLRTLSKGYGLAGLRFGYAIAQPAILQQIEKVRDSYPCDAISIAAATAAITDQEYAHSTWQKVIAERGRVTRALSNLGFKIPDSQSNFILAQVPISRQAVFAEHVYQTLKSRGILVRWWDLPRIADKLRITIGTPEQNDRLLAEIKTIMQAS